MRRQQAIARLLKERSRLQAAGIAHLYLFGSTARDEAGPESDVDLFFETDDPKFSLVNLVRVKRLVGDVLEADADITTRYGLHPALRSEIEMTAERVF